MHRNRALLLLPLLVAACASPDGDYPSLAVREAEVSGTFEPVAPAPYVPPPTPSGVLGRLDQLRAEAASAHQAFLAEAPGVRGTVAAARGAAVGSEAWAQAEVALAGLQAQRSRAMIALADLDRLYVDAAVAEAELTRIAAAREAVAVQVAEQDRTIETLLASLPR